MIVKKQGKFAHLGRRIEKEKQKQKQKQKKGGRREREREESKITLPVLPRQLRNDAFAEGEEESKFGKA